MQHVQTPPEVVSNFLLGIHLNAIAAIEVYSFDRYRISQQVVSCHTEKIRHTQHQLE